MTMSHRIKVPDKGIYMISKEHSTLLKAVETLSNRGLNCNVLIRGNTGCGKSELVTQFAATHRRPLAVLEIGQLSESKQIFGYTDLRDGETAYIPGLFTQAIQTPNCVVHLQEINRPETDKALNAIFSVLDDTFRSVYVDEMQTYVKVAPGVTFFATLNEGYEFIGTMPLDVALENRFEFKLEVGYLPSEIERNILLIKGLLSPDDTTQLLSMVNTLRQNTETPIHISTRDTINMARLVGAGVSLFLSLKTVVGSSVDKLESLLLSNQLEGVETPEIDDLSNNTYESM